MPNWIALTFQDSNSPTMEHIMFFHDHSLVILILITVVTLYITLSLLNNNSFNNFFTEGEEIETIWTVFPAFILIFIALPSLNTLYLIEDTNNPSLTINATGHQWYWSYEHSSLGSEEIENFMENSNNLRLLNTSSVLNLPIHTSTRSLVTAADVIHSWSVPSIGVNIDALPGLLNQTFLIPTRLGVFTGQCSEICGMNHSFIPILIEIQTINKFIDSINS